MGHTVLSKTFSNFYSFIKVFNLLFFFNIFPHFGGGEFTKNSIKLFKIYTNSTKDGQSVSKKEESEIQEIKSEKISGTF